MKRSPRRFEGRVVRFDDASATTRGRNLLSRTQDAGLTLIELLIVLTIMSVLSGIAVFSMGGLDGKSKIEACKTDAAAIRAAQQAYKSSIDPGTGVARGVYAPTTEVLQAGDFLAPGKTMHTVVTRREPLPAGYVNPITLLPEALPGVRDLTVFFNHRIAPSDPPPAPELPINLLIEDRADDSFYYLATRPVAEGKVQPCIPNQTEALLQSPRNGPAVVHPETMAWLLTLQNSETVL